MRRSCGGEAIQMRLRVVCLSVLSVFLICFAIGCGTSGTTINNTPVDPGGGSSQTSTVFVVVLENKNYDNVVGSSAMPYFNSLIPQGALATKYYANIHPSLGDYMMLTTGLPTPTDDSFTGTVTDDNIARQLVAAGKTWKIYAESIPSVGYTGEDVFPYIRRHNPFSFFSDVKDNSAQAANMVPMTQLSTDLSSGTLPNLAFIVPNALNDGHDCAGLSSCTVDHKAQQSDEWMQSMLPSILGNSSFKTNGVLVVTWDEAEDDATNGGGHIATLFLGPQVKVNFQSTTTYQHQDLLRMMSSRLGLPSAPGAGASASTMSEFFTN
jgi:phosphatidylinositol-3-phosphatase